ncbi:MAG: NAD-dependent protein deacetylase [Lachnospiraceae bacterium]|nr:NAD-dependent protein deacetylase [Lachnospiraceae bacterium]
MSCYENLVMKTQTMNYSRHYGLYQRGGTAVVLTEKESLPYEKQICLFAEEVDKADCIVVGAASGLSAADGGDFYYEPTASFYANFGKFAERYGFRRAFDGTFYRYDRPEDKWAYLATFLHTTLTAPIRKPYLDLRTLLEGKDYFILTTNQDTQAIKAFPEDKVAEIQGDHRYFQCSRCCTDDTWDAVKPVEEMIEAMGDGTTIPTDMVPHCPHCGAEAFPWVRGYGNFLQGRKYDGEYQKISRYIQAHQDKKTLFLEFGVGRITPMFIQEPFWELTKTLPDARYIAVNDKYDFVPKNIEDKGMAIVGNISTVLEDVLREKGQA